MGSSYLSSAARGLGPVGHNLYQNLPQMGNFLDTAWNGQPAHQVGLTQGYDFLQDPRYQQASNLVQNSPYGQEFNPQQGMEYFQQGVADPIQKYFKESILPSIYQNYSSEGMGRGSALDNALSKAATDVGTNLGALRANYLQTNQQQHNQGQMDLIARALGLSQARAGQTTPIVQEAQSGWLQDILKLIAGTAGSYYGARR